ncbi:MAG: caspase family protein [Paludibacteraceae bacterium]
MKRYLLLVLLIGCVCVAAAEKRALVIGIGAYPDVDYGWRTIYGDKDIPLVTTLLTTNGYDAHHIVTLCNRQATFDGISTAFADLIQTAQTDDEVYIHFSGHGQRITDLDGDEGAYGFDEAWVPYDALSLYVPQRYRGERHITDDMLNQWLWQLRHKVGRAGRIIVVVDACHSCGSTRDVMTDEEMERGGADFIIFDAPHVTSATTPRSEDWLVLSACTSEQSNKQCVEPPCGSLTYSLYLLRDQLSKISCVELLPLLQTKIFELIGRAQTPMLDGPDDYKRAPLFTPTP